MGPARSPRSPRAAAAGLALALAACTPHGEAPQVQTDDPIEMTRGADDGRHVPTKVQEKPEIMIEGGLKPEPPPVEMVDGELEPYPEQPTKVEEPCQKPTPSEAEVENILNPKSKHMVRGALKATPTPKPAPKPVVRPGDDMIDGMLEL